MTIQHLFPTAKPTLDLNFAGERFLDPRITFSRSSIGTYVDEDGIIRYAAEDEPRFDHDPLTGESLGLLIEESRTNLLPESGNLNDQTYWNSSTNPGSLNQANNAGWIVVTSNTTEIVSPDGTNNAVKLAGDITATNEKGYKVHVVPKDNTIGMNIDTVYSYTVWINDPESLFDGVNNVFCLMHGSKFSPSNPSAEFDLVNNTVTFDGANISSDPYGKVEDYPNGWKKLTASFANTGDGGGPRYFLREVSNNTGSVTRFSANGEKFYAFGFQVEEGSFPTSYIATNGTTEDRAADICSIEGDNFSSWWNTSEGTIVTFADNFPTNAGFRKAWEFNKGSNVPSGPTLLVTWNNNTSKFESPISGNYTNSNFTFFSTIYKTAIALATGDLAGCGDGGLILTNTGGLDPDVAKVYIGRSRVGTEILNGHISRLAYYPRRLSDEQLKALTS